MLSESRNITYKFNDYSDITVFEISEKLMNKLSYKQVSFELNQLIEKYIEILEDYKIISRYSEYFLLLPKRIMNIYEKEKVLSKGYTVI